MSFDLSHRFRRLRKNPTMRRMLRETHVRVDDLIYPIFIEEGIDEKVEISTMPGVYRYPEAMIPEVMADVEAAGVPGVMLFGVSHHKDAEGSDAMKEGGLLFRMVKAAKHAAPNTLILADTCFCEYTDHGHCGVLVGERVDNDLTLENLQKQAVIAAEAGADIIAPSGMMDGMVEAIRFGLDEAGFKDVPIMSYSTKFASALYGPFREAAGCSLKGDRKTYQMDFANPKEALAESLQDEIEGADMLMVKPGVHYLDVLANVRQNTLRPLAVYHVSGEYAMIKFAAQNGAFDEKNVVLETMTAFKRAGADMVMTYFALDIARWLKEGENNGH